MKLIEAYIPHDKEDAMPKETEEEVVKTSLKMPRELWKATHIRAMDDGTDFQTVVARALEAYLLKKGGGR